MTRRKREGDIRIVGGCPCGIWSAWNCRYVRAVRVCKYRGPAPEQLADMPAIGARPSRGGA